ncbi:MULTISPECIES: TrbI/VirB10 family protein [Rhodanobacteraceae]|uniref:TrbI/VirB10 family protein n=1 Tax=Rhodanobacteraceae TaxID=1775411 RepID=UPI000885B0D5|nr:MULTISPECIES: TrbI/VirB10 family protein [Rhodanobacteraceae]SDH03665.1 type IV secretion system protein VirB10 [Dyella sp. 333MFSha]SKC05639.1 type IV secretion system protein VirB10 [Luteibacter sp. 22Crub2.1]
MSPNNPYHPDEESNGSNVPPQDRAAEQHDPLANNPYSNNARQTRQPDLDSAAPQLTSNDMQRMNRKALGLLASIALLLLVIGFWVFGGSSTKTPPKVREETVSIPEAPRAPPPMPPENAPTPPPADPIALKAPPVPSQMPPMPTQPEAPRGPTLLERRIAASNGGTNGVANAPSQEGTGFKFPPGAFGEQTPAAPSMSANGNLAYSAKELPDVSSATPLTHPDTIMLRGTFIRCVLETRIITDIPGFTSCVVTEPVYSFTGKRLLLPKGSKVMGKYEMEPSGPRVAVIWDRIVTPTGIDVNMASPGIDALGGAGHPGYYNAHWGSRIGAALLISLLSDAFKYEAAEHGPKSTTISNGVVTQTPFESNTADTIQQLANQAVQRQANRPATVTINQGTVLAIYVAKDVDFTGVVARY